MILRGFRFQYIIWSLLLIVVLYFVSSPAMAEWKVDLTRRSEQLNKHVLLEKQPPKKTRGFFDTILNSSEPVQEIVILNTEKGFIPAKVQVRAGNQYKVHVVNVAEEAKNVSFVLDSFSEFHSTYYGKINTFTMKPKKIGVFSFQCPETSAQGRLVVVPGNQGPKVRMPASEQ